jgi:hypothetical protein
VGNFYPVRKYIYPAFSHPFASSSFPAGFPFGAFSTENCKNSALIFADRIFFCEVLYLSGSLNFVDMF